MKTSVNKLSKSQVELKVEISAQEFNHFIDKATLNLGKDLEIKGFRKGKVPKEIIEKQIGQEKILIEAADLAVRENYSKAILENKIEAISQPKIEIQKMGQGNSFIFLAKTATLPKIELPDYKKIASEVKRKETKTEDKEIEAALKWLQRSRAKLTLKNQSAQKGDFVEIEYRLSSPGENQPRKDGFILGEGYFLPGFEENIIGMKPNEEKDNITLKKDGKDLKVKLKLSSVQTVELPKIDDQFAKSLGQFDNLVALKKNIKQGLTLEKEQAESQRVRNEILEKISKEAKCETPEVLVEGEQKQMIENLKRNVEEKLKISFTDYLNKVKKTEKEMLDSFLDQAQKKVKYFLILGEIGKKEKVEVLENEVKERMDKVLKQYAGVKKAQENLDPERLKEYTKEVIKTEKIFSLLENLAKPSSK